MSLLKLGQSQFVLTKEHPYIIAATKLLRPWLNSPILQVVISFVLGYYATTKISKIIKKDEFPTQLTDSEDNQVLTISELRQEPEALRLTQQQLRIYNGVHDSQHIYTALNGNIYDLSSSRKTLMQPGLFSLLAGCNANQVLNIACGSMGVSADDVIERWERCLNAEFNIIGHLIEADASECDENTNENLTLDSRE